jgi:hypothetical protein
MEWDAALGIARQLLLPASELGYGGAYYGRHGLPPKQRGVLVRAIGQLMGNTYSLLGEIRAEHPTLDPARDRNALGLPREGPPPESYTRETVLAIVDEYATALASALPALLRDADSERKTWTKGVLEEIRAAERIIREELRAP